MAKEIKKKAPIKRMSKEDQKQLDAVYDYLRYNILGYKPDEQGNFRKVSSYAAMRIKGLAYGKFYENNYEKDKAKYTYEMILNTFKYCSPEIMSGMRTMHFNDEKHKINYVMKIVEANINTVCDRMKRKKASKEKVDSIDTSQMLHQGAAYKKKTENVSAMMNDLW